MKSSYELYFVFAHNNHISLTCDRNHCDLAAFKKIINKDHVEELLDCAYHLSLFPYTMPHEDLAYSLNLISTHNQHHGLIRKKQFDRIEPFEYKKELGYGGCFYASTQNDAIAYVVGEPQTIVRFCNKSTDTDEILRVSDKLKKQKYEVAAFAQREELDPYRNILLRGVRSSMTYLGMIAWKKLGMSKPDSVPSAMQN